MKRFKVTLVPRMVFYRMPRTRRRRILKKWRKRPENYRPLMVPLEQRVFMGAMAAHRAHGGTSPPPNPDWDYERFLEMTPELWELVKVKAPAFAAQCDLFRMETRMYLDRIPMDVPVRVEVEARGVF